VTIEIGNNFDLWACIQAVGSILAILAGIGVVLWQEWQRKRDERRKENELAKAAGDVAREALVLVEARLNSALFPIGKPILFWLRNQRTTEVVQALRELRISTLPNEIIASVVRIRSGVYAVNTRISEVFDSEPDKKAKARRWSRLESCGRVLSETIDEFAHLRSLLSNRHGVELAPIIPDENMVRYMRESLSATVSDEDAFD
jgi:type II secretory pathway pseudopilin PulG